MGKYAVYDSHEREYPFSSDSYEKGKKYDVVDAEHGECVGCCFNKDGCTLDIDIPCRKEFIYKEIENVEG